jgi:hypothetical protein
MLPPQQHQALTALANRVLGTMHAAGYRAHITAASIADDAIYLYAPASEAPAFAAMQPALTVAMSPNAVTVADYGQVCQIGLHTPTEPEDGDGDYHQHISLMPAEMTGQAIIDVPAPAAMPAVAVALAPKPPSLADQLRPWWRVHRTEPGCVSAAIRYIYGPNAPPGGSFYNAVKRAIEEIDAGEASEGADAASSASTTTA